MLQDHVRALLDQCFCSVRFFRRVFPCESPDDVEFYIGVNALGVQVGGVDATDNFWNWERCDVPNFVGFGHLACDVTLDGAAFVETRRVGRHVIGCFVASCVLKFHVREFGRNVDGRVHVTKRGREDKLGTGKRHLCHHALGVRAFWNAFLVDGFNFVAECFINGEAALVVLICPATVTDGAHVNKAHFELFMAVGECA